MITKINLLLLALLISQSEPRFLAIFGQTGHYCDQWNKCASTHRCVSKKCTPIACSQNQNCPDGFQCQGNKCVSQAPAGDDGQYCDQWTPCAVDHKCVFRRCVPVTCQYKNDCASGFQCVRGKCIPQTYIGPSHRYCDRWTPCPNEFQCVDRRCVPLLCQITPDCAQGYMCYTRFCIQINNSHTRGRYCDANNQCDFLHTCYQNQCVWK